MSRNNHFNSNNRIWMPLLIDCVHFLETFVESFASGSTKSICRTFWLLAVHINKCLIIKFQLNDKNKTKMFWRQIEFSEIVFRFCFCTGLSHIPSLEYVHTYIPILHTQQLWTPWGDDKNKQSRFPFSTADFFFASRNVKTNFWRVCLSARELQTYFSYFFCNTRLSFMFNNLNMLLRCVLFSRYVHFW